MVGGVFAGPTNHSLTFQATASDVSSTRPRMPMSSVSVQASAQPHLHNGPRNTIFVFFPLTFAASSEVKAFPLTFPSTVFYNGNEVG
ncbi:hypothetical protein TNCT_365651 [Trichonephila clavata]|uniref:Uncharacterized protein n=1 Tax=Trichonephila clavata TaxID=2740835 RepID=A0A8X6ICN0_TRICU|nr:hypothetical protein TNCT_365651 [Trichonephila clavata]